MRQRHLVVMAAGTGGHVIPGLAVAREMRSRGWSVSWLGTTTGMENRFVPPAGIALDTISFTGLRGKGLLHTLTGGMRLLGAFWSCLKILRTRRADAVLGMGGYVCFPGGMMASLLGRPLLLVNADAALLLSNKLLLPLADCVAFGFDGDAARRTRNSVVTGNPVRAEIEALPEPALRFEARSGALRLLVVGGSLGAKVLNECVPQALALVGEAQRPVVMHQCGTAQLDEVLASYRRLGIRAEVAPFIDDMAEQLGACDVMICPPATLVAAASAATGRTRIAIGGQDCHPAVSGAHTGDVSAEMLADAGASAVIVGHSERRTDHGESDAVVRAKAQAARRAGLTAIVCVGETEAERRSGATLDVVARQLAGSLPDGCRATDTVVAYEPVWAIGTGLTPTVADVAEVHAAVRRALVQRFGEEGRRMRLLYGGSVKPANARELISVAEVNGALVGGASLRAEDFLGIIAAYR